MKDKRQNKNVNDFPESKKTLQIPGSIYFQGVFLPFTFSLSPQTSKPFIPCLLFPNTYCWHLAHRHKVKMMIPTVKRRNGESEKLVKLIKVTKQKGVES